MRFADKLDRAIEEAMTGPAGQGGLPGMGMLDAAGTVQMSKQRQRVRIIDKASEQAVKALKQIERVLKAPDYKGDASFDALAAQINNMIVGLDRDGNMRRSMTSLLTLPPEASK